MKAKDILKNPPPFEKKIILFEGEKLTTTGKLVSLSKDKATCKTEEGEEEVFTHWLPLPQLREDHTISFK